MIKSAKSALATHLGWDISDLKDYEYQSGRFTKTVFSLRDSYYCATKDVNKLPEPTRKNHVGFQWIEIEDRFVNSYGWKIFNSK